MSIDFLIKCIHTSPTKTFANDHSMNPEPDNKTLPRFPFVKGFVDPINIL